MAKPMPVTDVVRFDVTVTAYNREERWLAQTVETGLITFGATRLEAEALNAKANVKLVRGWKQHGKDVLDGFMRKHGIKYHIDQNPQIKGSSVEGRRLAA